MPVTWLGIERYLRRVRPELRADDRTRAAARAVLGQKPPSPALAPFQALTFEAGRELLPEWARRMHGYSLPPLRRPLVRAGAGGVAVAIRWAMHAKAA